VGAALVAAYHLPLEWLYVGEAVTGLTGGASLFFMAVFAGNADLSDPASRVWKVARMEGALFVGEVAGSMAGGALTQAYGFPVTFLFCVILTIAGTVGSLVTAEPLPSHHVVRAPLTAQDFNVFKTMAIVLRSKDLFLLTLAFTTGVAAFVGFLTSAALFFRTALGWSPSDIGYFTAADVALRGLGVILLLPLLHRIPWLSDNVVATVGFLAFGAQVGALFGSVRPL
jgi:hypothetical protein